jgi:AraC-like DNA-binding protein
MKGGANFDWEPVFAKLAPGEAIDDAEAKLLAAKMATGLTTAILEWLLQVNLQDHRALKAIGVRAVVMAWVLNPERFEGASMTTLAKSLGYSSGSAMNPEAAEFSRQFGIRNKFQEHNWRLAR